jgi:hypothetical protein
VFRCGSARSVTKLPPLCSPSLTFLLTSLTSAQGALSESHRRPPPPALFCLSTLDDGTLLGSGGPLCVLPPPGSPRFSIKPLEMRSLGTLLPPLVPLSTGGCGGAFQSCHKCLFLTLLTSLLNFSSGQFSRLRFWFSSARCSLCSFL